MVYISRVSIPEAYRALSCLCYIFSNKFVLLSTALQIQSDYLPPIIKFQKWLPEDELQWQRVIPSGLSSDAYLQVSENVYDLGENTHGIMINCSGPYPVQWVPFLKKGFDSKFESFLAGIDIYSVREFEDFNNVNSYRYTSQLLIASYYKELTANYSCQSVANASLKSDIYLYVEGSTPEKLIHSGETIEIVLNDQKFLEFPCSVSSPDVNVYLHKEEIRLDGLVDFAEWVSVLPLDGVSYSPINGFNVSADDPSFLLGRFRCTTDEEDDLVYIDVVSNLAVADKTQRSPSNYVLSPAKLEFEKENQQIICCSNSNKPPRLIILYCSTVQECNIWDSLDTSEKNGRLALLKNTLKINGSCSYSQFYIALNAKVICEGDGVNQDIRMVYSFLQDNKPRASNQFISSGFEMNFLGESIPLEKAVSVQLLGGTHSVNGFRSNPLYLKNGDTVEAFSKEKLVFTCRASPYFFAHMVVWSVQMNETTKLIPKVMYPDLSNYRDMTLTLSLTANDKQSRMTSITCHGPLWNSSAWVNTTINLKITQSEMPKISSPNPSIVYWAVNTTNNQLTCNVFGRPTPKIKWLRNGKDLNVNPVLGKITHLNGTLTLNFHKITTEMHGEYVCQAKNVAGINEQSFIVIVEESHSTLAYWIMGIILLLSTIALGAVFWKARIHRRLLNNISGSTELVA